LRFRPEHAPSHDPEPDFLLRSGSEAGGKRGVLGGVRVGEGGGADQDIAEGANRFSPKQKRPRYQDARSEAGEVASHLERLYRYELLGEAETRELLTLANRVCAMQTGLIRHCSP